MNTILSQPVPTHHHHRRLALVAAGLLAIGTAGVFASRTLLDGGPKSAAIPETQSAVQPNTGLSLILGASYPAAAVSAGPNPVVGSGYEVAFGPAGEAVSPPAQGDANVGAAFSPASVAAGWASIRYSTHPGLALILSDLYPSS